MSWRDHPLCASEVAWPARFWGPETIDPDAWRELVPLLDPGVEIDALCDALAGVDDVVDVGGGTGLITQAIAKRVGRVTIVEPSAAQRAHLPPGLVAVEGRAEAVPMPDGGAAAAVATWVLQYTADPVRAVQELARVARERVAIVQAAPGNDLVEVYNREAAIAGTPPAHHGWLLALAAETLEASGFAVTLTRVPTPVRIPDGGVEALADVLARLHFAGHPRIDAMRAAAVPVLGARAWGGVVADDGVLLVARR